MKSLWREEKGESVISLIIMLGVVVAGSMDAIMFAVLLALVRFIRIVSRPRCEVLGRVLRWFVLDLVPITSHDVTGRRALLEIENELNARGVTLVLAGRRTELTNWRRARGYDQPLLETTLQFETVGQAVRVFGQQNSAS